MRLLRTAAAVIARRCLALKQRIQCDRSKAEACRSEKRSTILANRVDNHGVGRGDGRWAGGRRSSNEFRSGDVNEFV